MLGQKIMSKSNLTLTETLREDVKRAVNKQMPANLNEGNILKKSARISPQQCKRLIKPFKKVLLQAIADKEGFKSH